MKEERAGGGRSIVPQPPSYDCGTSFAMVAPVPPPYLSRQQSGASSLRNAPKRSSRVILYIQVGALGNNARRAQPGHRGASPSHLSRNRTRSTHGQDGKYQRPRTCRCASGPPRGTRKLGAARRFLESRFAAGSRCMCSGHGRNGRRPGHQDCTRHVRLDRLRAALAGRQGRHLQEERAGRRTEDDSAEGPPPGAGLRRHPVRRHHRGNARRLERQRRADRADLPDGQVLRRRRHRGAQRREDLRRPQGQVHRRERPRPLRRISAWPGCSARTA